MPKDSSGLLRGNKKSILHKLRLHLVVVSLPAALIIIKGPFQCIFKGLVVEEHGGLLKKEQKKVPQSVAVDALMIERNVTSLGFNHLPEYLCSLSWIWQNWQEETFSCTLISFLVHRSQHLHRLLFNTSEFHRIFTFERKRHYLQMMADLSSRKSNHACKIANVNSFVVSFFHRALIFVAMTCFFENWNDTDVLDTVC